MKTKANWWFNIFNSSDTCKIKEKDKTTLKKHRQKETLEVIALSDSESKYIKQKHDSTTPIQSFAQ